MTLTQTKPQTQPLTCATCPFARHLDGDRYVCTEPETASDVKRGHWEATIRCTDMVEALQEPIVEKPIAPAPEMPEMVAHIIKRINTMFVQMQELKAMPIPQPAPTKTYFNNHPFRYRWDIHHGHHSFSSACYGLCECDKCKVPETVEEASGASDCENEDLVNDFAKAMAEKIEWSEVSRPLPYPQPRFWFGDRVGFSSSQEEDGELVSCYWQEGIVTGMNYNPETCEWNYVVFWEDNSEEEALGYDNDKLLVGEGELIYAPC